MIKVANGIMVKEAIIGPLADVGNLGIPSAIGYAIGNAGPNNEYTDEELREIARGEDTSTIGKLAIGSLLPGYIGYRYGKSGKAADILRRRRDQEV